MIRSKFHNCFLLVFFFFLFSPTAFAQGHAAKLVFKDGSYTYCKARLKKDAIKYWERDNDKAETVRIKDLDYFQFKNKDDWDTFRRVLIIGENRFEVLQELEVGPISLYFKSESVDVQMASPFGPGAAPMMTSFTIFNYYVNREGLVGVEQLARNRLFSKDFRNAAVDYFADCPELVKKLQAEQYKQDDIREIVQFYNSSCSENKE